VSCLHFLQQRPTLQRQLDDAKVEAVLNARRDETREGVKEFKVFLAPFQAAHSPDVRERHFLHLLALHVENGQGLLRVLHVDRNQVLFARADYATVSGHKCQKRSNTAHPSLMPSVIHKSPMSTAPRE